MRRRSKWISLFAAATILVFMMLMQAGLASAAPFGNPYDQYGRWGYDHHGRWGYYYDNTSPTESNSLSTPVISPSGGAYTSAQTVTIGNISSGDTAYYTTDGSNPESSNTAVAYSGPFTVSQSETVLAAIHDPTTGWSSVASATLSISGSSSLQAPVISPGSGDYSTAQSVYISDIYGAAYYTTDGSNPEGSSTAVAYSGPFTVSQSETIQAVNYSSAGWSSVTSATFSISGSSTIQTGANSEQIDQLKQEILAAVNSNNWSNAEEILKQIIEIQQSDWAFTQLGQIYQQQGNSGVSVFSNGSQLDFDVQPVIVNDRTLVPIRGIANALGISDNNVSYSNGTVTVNNGSSQIQISNNGQQAYLNGTAYSLDVPAQIVNGRMMVPLRAIGQMFNKNVQWYPSGRIVNIQ